MRLSINIPTYNRSSFLKKNIEIIISQICELKKNDDIEINISDNASTDTTRQVCKYLIDQYPQICIHYKCSKYNEGPDVNFIKAMKMAKGEYSILWGDDDYFKDGALSYILSEIEIEPEIGIFVSNRTNINASGIVKGDQFFFKGLTTDCIFDFSSIFEGKTYFYHAQSLGGILCFISSVVYKTSILEEIGEWDNRLNGTCYSFHYYWWKYLLRGNKVKYLHKSYLLCTTEGSTNNNYGKALDRKLVDFRGMNTIATLLFKDSPYYYDYISSPFKDFPVLNMIYLYCMQTKRFNKELVPYLIEAGLSEDSIENIQKRFSVVGITKLLIRRLLSVVK